MRSRVLVLGGGGFIGSHLCKTLRKLDYEVRAFDRCFEGRSEQEIEYIEGDFFDDVSLKRALDNVDYAVHALGVINPGNSSEKYMFGYSSELIQTIKFFDWASSLSVKTIYISSGGTVYGKHSDQPASEEDPLSPINHYGAMKASAELALRAFEAQRSTPMIIARLANPYGPGQNIRKGVGFIGASVELALRGQAIEIWGDGLTARDYIYIDDACGMLGALLDYSGDYRVFNIGSGCTSTQIQVLGVLKELGLSTEVKFRDFRSVDLKSVRLDVSRIKSIWPNKVLNLREGITQYLHAIGYL